MSVRLLVKQRSEAGGADADKELLLDDEVIDLGRDAACQVVLPQQAVSRTHARITRDGSLFFVEDLGSAFGTQLNGHALPRGEKRLLRNGDLIAIAQFDVTFDRITEAKGKPGAAARQAVKDVMRGLGSGAENPYFRIMNGPTEGQKIEIQEAREIVFGRDDTVDVALQDDLVSRRHAKVRRDWSGVHVEDLNSRNGIKVNRKKVQKKTLKNRDEVEIGALRLLFLDPAEVREAPVVLPAAEKDEEEEEATQFEPPPPPPPPAPVAPPPEPAAPAPAAAAEEEPNPTAEAPADEAPEGEEDESEDEEDAPEDEEVDAPAGAAGLMADKQRLVMIAAMGVFTLLALGLVIAVFAA